MGRNVIVIGGGVSGLATAALLARDGHRVTVIEKNDTVGGRAFTISEKGFTFDMGPSWYMMPDAFETYFAHFGKRASDFYELALLDPQYRVFFDGGRQYTITPDMRQVYDLFEKTESGAGRRLQSFLADSKTVYDNTMKDLVYLDYRNPLQLLSPRVLRMLPRLQLLNSFHTSVARTFTSPDLQKMLEFTSVFLGGSPYNTPAFYRLVTHADMGLKIWHPMGGMYKIIEALHTLCEDNGVEILTGEEVTAIDVDESGVAKHVRTETGSFRADIVVCAADYAHCETSLLQPQWQSFTKQYWKRKTLSPTALLLYYGIKGKLKNVAHHNLYFSDDWDDHFSDVFTRHTVPARPSYYVSVPTVTDRSMAPPGDDAIVFLVPLSSKLDDSEEVRNRIADHVVQHFEHLTGQEIQKRAVVERRFGRSDFASRYNSYEGSAFGIAHTLSQTALFRVPNFSRKVRNLYYAGQYTNPGIGVPVCLISAQIVTRLIHES